jgi:hypothetical protein
MINDECKTQEMNKRKTIPSQFIGVAKQFPLPAGD